MSTKLTGKQISNTYNQLLKVNVSTNTGITSDLQTIQSGDSTNSALQLSQGVVNINGTFALNGTNLTADASALNAITDLSGVTGIVAMDSGTAAGRTLTAGTGITISNGNGVASNPTIAVSLAGIHVSTSSGHFTGNVTAAGFYGPLVGNVTGDIDGATGAFSGTVSATNVHSVSINSTRLVAATGSFTTKVSGVAAEFSGNVSVGASIYAAGGVYTGTVSAAYFVGDGSGLTNVPSAEGGTVKTLVSGPGMAFTVGGVAATTIAVSGVIGLAANQTFGTVSLGTVAVTTGLSVPSGSAATFGVPISGTSAVFSGDVSADNVYAATQMYVGGVAVPDGAALTSINTVLAATSSALATSIGNSNSAITSINTVIGTVSSALATSIGNSNSAITSINTVIGTVSGALATSIGNSNTNITTNASAITSINAVLGDGSGFVTDSELATVSGALAASIGNSNTNITNNASAITSINTVVADTSSALATSIGNSNSAITSINTVIGTVSGALATSIANHLPLAGGTVTGATKFEANVSIFDSELELRNDDAGASNAPILSLFRDSASPLAGDNLGAIYFYGNDSAGNKTPYNILRGELDDPTNGSEDSSIYIWNLRGGGQYLTQVFGNSGTYLYGTVSAGDVYADNAAFGVNTLLGKDLHIGGAAVADLVSLTDGANISVDFNSGQNFHLTLGGNRTLDNPTNCVPGQTGSIFIVQDGTGSRTLAYGTSWEFIGGTAPTLTTDADAVDRLDYIVRTSTAVQSILSQGYS
tara:strand:+ start:1825 stop:4113 length:2289 start_codon:yes stop_codon:yes gene_type:complete